MTHKIYNNIYFYAKNIYFHNIFNKMTKLKAPKLKAVCKAIVFGHRLKKRATRRKVRFSDSPTVHIIPFVRSVVPELVSKIKIVKKKKEKREPNNSNLLTINPEYKGNPSLEAIFGFNPDLAL